MVQIALQPSGMVPPATWVKVWVVGGSPGIAYDILVNGDAINRATPGASGEASKSVYLDKPGNYTITLLAQTGETASAAITVGTPQPAPTPQGLNLPMIGAISMPAALIGAFILYKVIGGKR